MPLKVTPKFLRGLEFPRGKDKFPRIYFLIHQQRAEITRFRSRNANTPGQCFRTKGSH